MTSTYVHAHVDGTNLILDIPLARWANCRENLSIYRHDDRANDSQY